MTEKNWFIFRGDHHLGPFSFNEILEKVKLSQIDDAELTWCEGAGDWLPVAEQPAIMNALTREREEFEQERRQEEILQREQERERQEALIREQATNEPPPIDIPEEDFEEPPPLPPLPIEEPVGISEPEPIYGDESLDYAEEDEEFIEEIYEEVEDTDQVEDIFDEAPSPETQEEVETSESFFDENEADQEEVFEEDQDSTGEHLIEVQEDNTDSFYIQPNEEVLEEEPPRSSLRVYGGLGASVIGLGILVLALFRTLPSQRSLYDISGRDRDALRSVMARPYKGKAIHRLRPSKDFNALWLGTNFEEDAVLYIALKAIPGRVLGNDLPRLQGEAILKGKAAYFNELEVLEGESLVIGEYEYFIKGTPVGMLSKIKNKKADLKFSGKILVSPFSEENFEKKLAEYQSRIEKTVIQPVKNRLQRYRTYLGLIERLREIYKNTLSRITKGKSIYIFENRYNEEVGPILRDLIIDDNRLHISLINLKPEESKAYEESMNFGKDIGTVASEMVTKTRRYQSISKKRTEYLVDYFEKKLVELEDQGNLKRKFLENELAPYEKN